MLDVVDRFPLYPLIVTFIVYPALAWLILDYARPKVRTQSFTVLNVACVGLLCWLSGAAGIRFKDAFVYTRLPLLLFSLYLGFTLLNFVVLRSCRRDRTLWPAAAFLIPIIFLAYIKYASDTFNPFASLMAPVGVTRVGVFFVGISYLSFRLVHLVQEVRNEVVEMPTIWEYLAFSFFVPTISIGPINPYSKFIGSFRSPDRSATPIGRSFLRILIGFTKYIFLGSLAAQFTYAGLLRDGHPHAVIDLAIAIPAYAIYLYCNFSGFCDMVIGVSGLLNIQVAENFDRPFLARNLQEFWTRWHITLSTWIRDLMFTPLTKTLMRRFGPKAANHVIAASILISFLVVGIWHGKGFHFLVFGATQGIGIAAVHYYTVWLKKRLGRENFAAYRKNKAISAVGAAVTFIYFSLSLFVFANNWSDVMNIRAHLR